MIGQGISEVMVFAIGVAISPLPIIAVILMLISGRSRANGSAFLLGWVLGLTAVSVVVYVLADASDVATDSGASDRTSTLKIVLGAVLLVLALRVWRRRNEPGHTPKWMVGVESVTPGRAVVLGVALAAVNPKNLILTVGAAAGLGQLGLDTAAAVVSIAFFVVLASVLVGAPVVMAVAGGAKAQARLDELKASLTANHATVMAVLLLVFGVLLISKGTGLLSS